MRTWGSLLLAVVLAMLVSETASAGGALIPRGGGEARIAEARVVVSATSRFLQLTVEGNERGFVWLVPADARATFDAASAEWIEDLLTTTEGESADRSTEPLATPKAVGIATDAVTLTAMVQAGGGAMDSTESDALAPVFAQGRVVLVLAYDATTSRATTGVLKVTEPSAMSAELPWTGDRSVVPLTLLLLGTASTDAGSDAGVLVTRTLSALPDVARGGFVSGGAITTSGLRAGGGAAEATYGDASPDAASMIDDNVAPTGEGSAPALATTSTVPAPAPAATTGTGDDSAPAIEAVGDTVSAVSSGGCDGSSDSSDDSGSGCDSSSRSSDDSSAGCSGSSSSDSSPDCAVTGTSRHRRGVGVRALVFGMAALAWVRRRSRRRPVA